MKGKHTKRARPAGAGEIKEDIKMYGLRKVELSPMNQAMLERKYTVKLQEIDGYLKKNTARYENWDTETDARVLKYGREGYKEKFIDYWMDELKYYTGILENVRQGFIFE